VVSNRLAAICLLLSFFSGNSLADDKDETFKLSVSYPETDSSVQQSLQDKSKYALNCIFDKMHRAYVIDAIPWKRAKRYLSTGFTAGAMTSMLHPELDGTATLSAPLALEKWYWYFSSANSAIQSKSKIDLQIGAIEHSNQATWLQAQGYTQLTLVSNSAQLKKLIELGRIDAFIADQNVLTKLSNVSTEIGLQRRFLGYIPQGVYFSNQYLKRHPDFLSQFNHYAYLCAPQVLALSAMEQRVIHRLILMGVRKWISTPLVLESIRSQNQRHSKLKTDQIWALDLQWRKEIKTAQPQFISVLLKHPLSIYLQEVERDSNGLFSEIFITDNLGLNVAMSKPTSDYWQGDETKFERTFNAQSDDLYIDSIRYDQSAKKFQSQVSLRIIDPATEQAIGMVTIGVDVEQALARGF